MAHIRPGDSVIYGNAKWLVVDVHGYPEQSLDLRRTIIVDPARRHLDEAECRRGVPALQIQKHIAMIV